MSDRRGWGAVIMMMVPVAIFAFLGLKTRPKPNVVVPDAGPFRITLAGVESLSLTPLQASNSYENSGTAGKGRDTKLRMKLKLQGRPFSGPTNYEYVAFCSIVSDASAKKGKTEIPRLWTIGNLRSNDRSSDQSPLFMLNLRDIPLSRGALRARFSFYTAPGKISSLGSDKVDAYARQLTSGLYGFVVKREIVLRAKGQKTPAPKVSTDPLFDIQKIEILPYKVKGSNDNGRVVIHIIYRGPLSEQDGSLSNNSYHLAISDSGGRRFGRQSGGDFLTQDKPRHYRFDKTMSMRPFTSVNVKKPLILKGWLSINDRWPRQFRVEIPSQIGGAAKSRK